jgi:hypothetical protein
MTECVLWAGGVYRTGYGRAYVPGSGYGKRDGRDVLAHRMIYERERGPIPVGMQIHHRCENRLCVNVEHMEIVRVDEHAGGRGHGKLTLDTAAQVKRLLAGGARGIDVAAQFGISAQQVCNIRKGRCWA